MENIALYAGNQDTQLKNVSLMKVLTMDHISQRHKTDPKEMCFKYGKEGHIKKRLFKSIFVDINYESIPVVFFSRFHSNILVFLVQRF